MTNSINVTVQEINRLRMAGYDTRVLEIHLQSLLREKARQDIQSRKGKKSNGR